MAIIPAVCRLFNCSLLLKASTAVSRTSSPSYFRNASTTPRSSTVAVASNTSMRPKIEYSSFFEGAAEDRKLFLKHYEDYAKAQTSVDSTVIHDQRLGLFYEHYRKALDYILPHGKMSRALPLHASYKFFNKNPEKVTEEEIFQCSIVAWCFETIHSYVLMTDDIIDGSAIRRKQTCWHLKDLIGLSAINDAFSMHSGAFKALYKFCRDKPYYVKAMELVNEHCWEVHIGQTMDILLQVDQPSRWSKIKELHTMDNYMACIEYKTSATFWPCLCMALYMNGITDPEVHEEMRDLVRTLGYLFQYQNDGVDLYGDPEKTIRLGSDVEDGKCTIFSVKGFELGDSRQVKILEDNIGRNNPTSAKLVKDVYSELGFAEYYGDLTRNTYNDIFDSLKKPTSKLPEEWFRYCIRLFFEDNAMVPK